MKKLLTVTILLLAVLGLGGCGSGGDSGSLPVNNPTPPPPVIIIDPGNPDAPVEVTASAILLSTSSSAISPNGTASINVTLYDSSGQLVSGVKYLTLSLDAPALGSITSPVLVSNGFTTVVFTARAITGNVTITATVDGVSETIGIQISNTVAAATADVTSNPASITLGGTSVISATIKDSTGALMPNGTSVNFSLNNTALGSIPSSARTTNGIAQGTFAAGITTPGTATVTATSGSATGSTTIEVTGTNVGSIEFLSALPQIISITGSGGQETSAIKFLVKDSNGNPYTQSKTVELTLSGPNGGEYLTGGTLNDDGTSTVEVGTDISGVASTILHSGTIPGTATITATVVGTALTTSSGVIAIGGGTPSAGHFSLSVAAKNLAGGYTDNITNDILVLLADRYGNKDILTGTAVSFYSECGAIDRAVLLDSIGQGTVVFRTQSPFPQDVPADTLGTMAGSGSCGATCDVENDYISAFNTAFAFNIAATGNNPRDGLCTITVVVDGEEEFTDANASGAYESGENFVDTYDDIHIEMDDDGDNIATEPLVPGKPFDPAFEDLVVDRNGNRLFNGLNGAWDSNKRISKRINLLFTGEPALSVSPTTFDVPNGGSKTFKFALHDQNFNRPIAGTTISAKITGAVTVSGTITHTYIDSNGIGSPILSFTIRDKDPVIDAPTPVEIEFSWTWNGNAVQTEVISGTSN